MLATVLGDEAQLLTSIAGYSDLDKSSMMGNTEEVRLGYLKVTMSRQVLSNACQCANICPAELNCSATARDVGDRMKRLVESCAENGSGCRGASVYVAAVEVRGGGYGCVTSRFGTALG